MERDEDEQDLISPNAHEPGQGILGEAQSEDDDLGPDAPDGSDQSAESQISAASSPPQEADPRDEDPEGPEAHQEATLSGTAAVQPAGQGTRIELPAELDISSARQPQSTTGDQQNHLLPLDRGHESASAPNPVDQIFPPEWRLPLDPGGSSRPPDSAAAADSPANVGDAIPRVQVLVTLLASQTMYAEAIDEALEKHAPKYRQIAESEVKHGFWQYENQRRAADWRLRGP